MAHNPLIDVAQAMMIDYYGLNEKTYMLVDIKIGNKNVPITMDDGHIPVKATFPMYLVVVERMQRMMTFDERVTEIRKQREKGGIPESWYDPFFAEIQEAEKQITEEKEGKKAEVNEINASDIKPGETKKLKPGKNKIKLNK